MQTHKRSRVQNRSGAWWLFWSSVGLLLYTYIGFPVITLLRALLTPRPVCSNPQTPAVSIIIAAYNEEHNIVAKLDNTLALNYPREQLEILVASDGSDDQTNVLVESYAQQVPEVQLLALPRSGKNTALNTAVAASRSDILVFTDADGLLQPNALCDIVAHFADPQVGGVSGDFHYIRDQKGEPGERTYWQLDRQIKQWQSRAGSSTATTGAGVYAIRRQLFQGLPGGVTDDFFNVTRVVGAHKRMIFEPRAIVYGEIAPSAEAEFRRKVRVAARGLRGVWYARHLLNPITYGWISWQLFSHKVLRRLMGIPLTGLFLASPWLWQRGLFYQLVLAGQLGLHGAALVGWLGRRTKIGQWRCFRLPFYFDMVNVAGLIALWKAVRSGGQDRWSPTRNS